MGKLELCFFFVSTLPILSFLPVLDLTSIFFTSQFHLSCTELDAAPKGDWLCPDCSERFAKNAGKKKKPQGKRRR